MPLTFPEYECFDGLGLASLIDRRVLSPTEVLTAAIERIELWNPKLNAVIHKMYDQAQSLLATDLSGPFKGVPILLKDILAEYQGTPICYGSRFAYNANNISQQDSEVVKRLKQAGIVIVGKTNLPEFGLSPVTEPLLFGPTRNPWDLEKTPGGSSGGSAAAVAARIVPFAHGGDGGGSIRMPASFTGLFGFKPSRGRTPVGPIFMRVWQGMVVEHALTRSVRDSAAILDVLAGPELGSSISLAKPRDSFTEQLIQPLSSLRIAVIDKPFFTATVHPEYREAQQRAAHLCMELGHRVTPETLLFSEDLSFAFLIIMAAETAAGLKTLEKHLGRKPQNDELEKLTAMLVHAAEEFTSADYAWASYIIDMAGLKLARFFEKYDVILTPTVPFPAPKIGEYQPTSREKFVLNLMRYLPYGTTLRQAVQHAAAKKFTFMAFTALFNIGGNPAMSVPLYVDKEGMPIGIQFAGKVGSDAMLLQLAQQLENSLPWVERQPRL